MELRAVHATPLHFRAVHLALGLGLVAADLLAASSARGGCGTPDGTVRIAAVDERLDVLLSDGRTVRLGGVASPDPVGAPTLAGAARDFLANRFLGRDGELERLASETDRWGRVVADIVISDPGVPDGRISVASAVLAAGYARVAPAFEARACVPARLAVEDQARRAGLGVWTDPRYAVIAATDAEALRASDGRLVVIEGVVRRVGIGRSRLYFDFVAKDGPTVVVPRKLESAFARAGRPSTPRPARQSVLGGRSTTVWVRDSRSANRR